MLIGVWRPRLFVAMLGVLGVLGCTGLEDHGRDALEAASSTSTSTSFLTSSSSGAGSGGDARCASYVTCASAPEPASEPRLILGSGKECFAPFTSSGVAPVVSGPQGGYHVWVAVRTSGFAFDPTISLRIIDDSGSIALVDPMLRTLEPCGIEQGWSEQAHLFGFLAVADPSAAALLIGTAATLDATLSDGVHEAKDTVAIVFGAIEVDAHHRGQ